MRTSTRRQPEQPRNKLRTDSCHQAWRTRGANGRSITPSLLVVPEEQQQQGEAGGAMFLLRSRKDDCCCENKSAQRTRQACRRRHGQQRFRQSFSLLTFSPLSLLLLLLLSHHHCCSFVWLWSSGVVVAADAGQRRINGHRQPNDAVVLLGLFVVERQHEEREQQQQQLLQLPHQQQLRKPALLSAPSPLPQKQQIQTQPPVKRRRRRRLDDREEALLGGNQTDNVFLGGAANDGGTGLSVLLDEQEEEQERSQQNEIQTQTSEEEENTGNETMTTTTTPSPSSSVIQNSRTFRLAFGLGIGVVLLWRAYVLWNLVWKFRHDASIQLAQPAVLAVLVVATSLAVVGTYFTMPLNDAYCLLRKPLLVLPLTIAGNTLVARIWRIHVLVMTPLLLFESSSEQRSKQQQRHYRIQHTIMTALTSMANSLEWCHIAVRRSGNKSGTRRVGGGPTSIRQKIPLWKVLWLLVILTIPQLLLQLVTVGVPSFRSVQQVDETGGGNNRARCSTGSGMGVVALAIVLILVPFLLAAYLSWRTSYTNGVPLPAVFQEGPAMMASAQVVGLVMVIVVPAFVLTENLDARTYLFACAVYGVAMPPIWFLVLPKLQPLWKEDRLYRQRKRRKEQERRERRRVAALAAAGLDQGDDDDDDDDERDDVHFHPIQQWWRRTERSFRRRRRRRRRARRRSNSSLDDNDNDNHQYHRHRRQEQQRNVSRILSRRGTGSSMVSTGSGGGGGGRHHYNSNSNATTLVVLRRQQEQRDANEKSAKLALTIGKMYEEMGFVQKSIALFDEALAVWYCDPMRDSKPKVAGGFTMDELQAFSAHDLELMIPLLIAKGRVNGTFHSTQQSGQKDAARAWLDALEIYEAAPASVDMVDRSIIFPIFSGLFVFLKGGKIQDDKNATLEQNLVRKFVHETNLHGDPIHYTRALAMQCEVKARLGKYKSALQHFETLKEVYEPEEHSEGIAEAYGTDRSAQAFAQSALWYHQLERYEESLDACEYVIGVLMPVMDPKNVLNSCEMLLPVMRILKPRGRAEITRIRELFDTYVIQNFYKHFGKDGVTPCLPIFKPMILLLDLCYDPVNFENIEDAVEWLVGDADAGVPPDFLDSVYTKLCWSPSSLVAELCLRVIKKLEVDRPHGNESDIVKLLDKAIMLVKRAEKKFRDKDTGKVVLPIAYGLHQPVMELLREVAEAHGVTSFSWMTIEGDDQISSSLNTKKSAGKCKGPNDESDDLAKMRQVFFNSSFDGLDRTGGSHSQHSSSAGNASSQPLNAANLPLSYGQQYDSHSHSSQSSSVDGGLSYSSPMTGATRPMTNDTTNSMPAAGRAIPSPAPVEVALSAVQYHSDTSSLGSGGGTLVTTGTMTTNTVKEPNKLVVFAPEGRRSSYRSVVSVVSTSRLESTLEVKEEEDDHEEKDEDKDEEKIEDKSKTDADEKTDKETGEHCSGQHDGRALT